MQLELNWSQTLDYTAAGAKLVYTATRAKLMIILQLEQKWDLK